VVKNKLKCLGLEEKQISFNEDDDAEEFLRTIYDQYPSLENIGGIEYMWVPRSGRSLEVIPPGSNGFDLASIKSSINTGKLYIRPIQMKINLNIAPSVSIF
jgi:hypothetical protein